MPPRRSTATTASPSPSKRPKRAAPEPASATSKRRRTDEPTGSPRRSTRLTSAGDTPQCTSRRSRRDAQMAPQPDDTESDDPIDFTPRRTRGTRAPSETPVKGNDANHSTRKPRGRALTPSSAEDDDDEDERGRSEDGDRMAVDGAEGDAEHDADDFTLDSYALSLAIAPPSSALPPHLVPVFLAHKRRILSILYNRTSLPCRDISALPTPVPTPSKGKGKASDIPDDLGIAGPVRELVVLLKGTVERGEGNSCLVMGGRGAGKTLAISHALSHLSHNRFLTLRLSGLLQTTDRLALREMARQLREQGGAVTDPSLLDGDDADEPTIDLSQSTLTALLALLSSSILPIVIILDEFDLFAEHPRQALLYCLLDCVQGGRRRGGLSVVGTTARVDCVEQLEKRVKSRFSHRLVHVSRPSAFEAWEEVARDALRFQYTGEDEEAETEFEELWEQEMDNLFNNPDFNMTLQITHDLFADVRILFRILAAPIACLTPQDPIPNSLSFRQSSLSQRPSERPHALHGLPHPALALVIATRHLANTDVEVFTFEQVYAAYDAWERRRAAMPTGEGSLAGRGTIGRAIWERGLMLAAFDQLVSLALFLPVGSVNQAAGEMRTYAKYRCALDPGEIKDALVLRDKEYKDVPGPLKKWGTTWQ